MSDKLTCPECGSRVSVPLRTCPNGCKPKEPEAPERITETQAREIERVRELPYPENNGSTHWETCWRERGHHNCAVAEVERLERERAEAWFVGWCEAVTDYAVWKDGEQLVGVMQRPLREVIEKKRKEMGL